MPTYSGKFKINKVFMGETKIKKIFYGTDLVFSGGTVVSYYKGNDLLGTEDVDEGETALSPSPAITNKLNPGAGNFFAGWSLTDGGEVLTHLDGNDDVEEIKLYAVIMSNILVVYDSKLGPIADSGGISDQYTIWNKDYVKVTNTSYEDISKYWAGDYYPNHDLEWFNKRIESNGLDAASIWHKMVNVPVGINVTSQLVLSVSLGIYSKIKISFGAHVYTSQDGITENKFITSQETLDIGKGAIRGGRGTTGNAANNYVGVTKEYTSDLVGTLYTKVTGDHPAPPDDGWAYSQTYVTRIELIKE